MLNKMFIKAHTITMVHKKSALPYGKALLSVLRFDVPHYFPIKTILSSISFERTLS
jgi:hypothetical protein